MNKKIIDDFIKAEEALSIANTQIGKELFKGDEKAYMNFLNKYKQLRDSYYDEKINNDATALFYKKSIEEAETALEYIDPLATNDIKELSDLIKENSKQLQNTVTYDPKLFIKKYFLNLPQKNLDNIEDVFGSDRFKEWFQNSKVVDSNNKPLLVFHGTGGSYEEFSNFVFKDFPGAYFAENKDYSDWFARVKGGNSYMFRCYLRVINPIDLTDFKVDKVKYEEIKLYLELKYNLILPESVMLKNASDANNGLWAWQYLRGGVDWLRYITKNTIYDGIHYYENNPGDIKNGEENVTPAWLVFNGNQIKTADMRNTTYSLFSDDIRMKKGGNL